MSEIEVYEVNPDDGAGSPLMRTRLRVRTHWSDPHKVRVRFGDGPEITVIGADLELAVRRATS